MDKLKVGIIGVSGYGGGELARLLLQHPNVELAYVTSGTYAGQPLAAALPGTAGRTGLTCEKFDPAAAADRCDFLFLAGENGLAMKVAPLLLEAGKKVVDLSADFRLKDPAAYKEWYKAEHAAPHLLGEAVYGLPEVYRAKITSARLVANPGCYPTSASLAVAPLLFGEFVERDAIIVDSMSGVSGAGRSKFGLDYHFSEVNESARPYGVGGVHRHTPEIEQVFSFVASRPVAVTFTPHLIPVTRGILTTAYVGLTPDQAKGWDLEGIAEEYVSYYGYAPFVTVLEPGQQPATKHVNGTNYCHIGLAVDKRTNRVIVTSVIDNLVKGAAGQAIQNMNLMYGFDETAGLTMAAVWP
ncbi:MAG: N-acetyl-gamma-glutamyl-phosphate reductase [Armatimonadetes bacterium]|nr:N-acetyl-gamma-glutamyl-phosphate reductase [Armatimonadota bacterium]